MIDDQRNDTPTKLNPSMTSFSSCEKRKLVNYSNELGKRQRIREKKSLGPNFASNISNVFLVERDRTKVLNKISIVLNIEEDTKTFSEAMISIDIALKNLQMMKWIL